MIAFTLVLALLAQTPAQPAAGNASLSQFLSSLQQAVSRNDRQAVAGMVQYPLEVKAGALQIPVADASTFVKLYDSLITPGVKQIIARARVPAEGKPSSGTMRTADGGIVLEGAVTISAAGGGFKLTTLIANAGGGAGGGVSGSPGEAIERQLTFRVGRPTQVSGTLQPNGADRYVFYAVRGALVDARLSGVPGRSVVLRVLNMSTGQPVDARADAGTRAWTGRVDADGNYRIEVLRQPDTGKEPLIYTMAVSVK